ncbi:MAG TPA: YciI family protein [Terriglobales bacterium]|nr:YciI family protein [Terriglobales bacterium]
MKFLMIVKANKDSEAGKMPSQELLASMGKYNEELMKAGVLVDLAGLHPSSKGFRVKFAHGKRTVMDGPFAETKELIAGFWIINVKSREEAMAWAKRIPDPFGAGEEAVVEVRQFFELEEFEPGAAVDRAHELGKKLEASRKKPA